jgi:hypothetical protein
MYFGRIISLLPLVCMTIRKPLHFYRYCTAWGLYHGDPTNGSNHSEAIAQTGQLLQISWSWCYRLEAQEPDHGYQVKMEEMGEHGTPVQHYHSHEHLLFERVAGGTANGSADADAGEV